MSAVFLVTVTAKSTGTPSLNAVLLMALIQITGAGNVDITTTTTQESDKLPPPTTRVCPLLHDTIDIPNKSQHRVQHPGPRGEVDDRGDCDRGD